MRYLIIIFLLTSQSYLGIAQVTFNKNYDFNNNWDKGYAVIINNSGNYVVSGSGWMNDYDGWAALYICEIDPVGEVVWYNTFGKIGKGIHANSKALMEDNGNYIVCGYENDSLSSIADILVVKFKSNGDTIWSKRYGGNGDDVGSKCLIDEDGNYIFYGYSTSESNGGFDLYLIKTDTSGNVIWENNYGGSQDDLGNSLHLVKNDGFILGGGTDSYGKGFTDAYIVKVDTSGSVEWSSTFGTVRDDCGCRIIPSTQGGYLMKSCIDTTFNSDHAPYPDYISKLDSAGNELWRKYYYRDLDSDLGSIKELINGDIIMLYGYTLHDSTKEAIGTIVKLNSQGDQIWERHYYTRTDRDNYFRDIEVTPDGGFVLAGWARSYVPEEQSNLWLVKLDSMGCLIEGCDTIKDGMIDISPYFNIKARITPNPFSDFTQISLIIPQAENKQIKFELFNQLGQITECSYEINSNLSNTVINLTKGNLNSGNYFYKVSNNRTALNSGKLIVN